MATDFTVDRDTVKYVLNSSGDIASVAIDTPAIEYNTDGSFKGLLVEPAATNVCLQSEDITTTWASSNATLTANDTTAPDGNTTADKLNDDNGGGTGLVNISQSVTFSTSTTYTFGCFIKSDGLTFAHLRVTNLTTPSNGGSFFNLSTGTVDLNDSGYTGSIQDYGNGWYRCSITFTTGATDTTGEVRIYPASSASFAGLTVDRDGTSSIFVWGAQVEASPIATSYIPTTTASVTRVKDDITQTSASSLIGQTEGTLYVEVDWRLTSGVNQYLLMASDGTFDNRVLIYNTSGGNLNMLAEAGDDIKTNQGESSSSYSDIQKFAFAYADADFELYRNGSSISSDTVGSLAALTTLTNVNLGQSPTPSFYANMWIRAVALFTRRLSDAEAQALTTL